jgi:hypothetical protein
LTINPIDSLHTLYWDWKISHYILGDINFDRKTDVVDILILADHIQGYQSILEFAFNPADLNMNEALEITDLYLLVYQIIGIIGN